MSRKEANEMLVQHARFLVQVSTQTAGKLTVDIIEAAKTLQEFPERGSWLNVRRHIADEEKLEGIFEIVKNQGNEIDL